MKAKLYSQLEYLKAEQAAGYLCYLTGVSATDATDVIVDYANQDVLVFYCDFNHRNSPPLITEHNEASWNPESTAELSFVEPIGRQRHEQGLLLIQTGGGVGALVPAYSGHCAIGFYGKVFRDPFNHTKHENWLASGMHLLKELGDPHKTLREAAQEGILIRAEVSFLRADIEALADQMDDEPESDSQTQEIDRLKAEVERLKADDEINPRKEETLYKLIMGMAVRGYCYDPDAPKNSAIAEICKDLDQLDIGLGERTIRNHLNAAKAYLPAKLIKT